MKKLIGLTLTILLSAGISTTAFAQISAGGGLAYGTEIESLGIQVNGVYTINEEFRAAADIIYYFPSEEIPGVDYNWFEFNANGHYLFHSEENLTAYALAGLNFARVSVDNEISNGEYTDNEVGLNIGAGIEYDIPIARFFAELKYALSSANQLVLTAGLRFPIKS